MAKITAPFKISGSLDDINFVVTENGNNYARIKGKTGITSEEFENNPIFDHIRQHGKEWGYCSKKAQSFRQTAAQLFRKAKDGSFAGRTNKLVHEILEEDTKNPKGQRKLETGIKSDHVPEILIGFEGNRNRPLHKILKKTFRYCTDMSTFLIADFNPENDLEWPSEEASHAHLQLAISNWDPVNETFNTSYSEEIRLEKNQIGTIAMNTETPEGNCWKITFLFIGFTQQQRRKHKVLHRKHNTVTVIACHKNNT